MNNLRGKLHSQTGASILLALLFLLVCMMAAAGVLMAAVSNAGKIQGNYQEQQRYLALSSAIRLVAEELERAEYRGWYTVSQWTETRTVTRPDGSTLTYSTDYYSIQQDLGAFSCGHLSVLDENERTPADTSGTPLDQEVLTFRKELDGLFAKAFTGTGCHPLSGGRIAALPTAPDSTRTLTVDVPGDLAEQFGSVTVEVDMGRSRRIHLKASLSAGPGPDDSVYIMEAELAPAGAAPAIDYSPGGRLPKDSPGAGGGPVTEHTRRTDEAVTWQLDWITGEIEREGEGG